ncbi:hypothetical protein AAF712_015365, partial [Marasmius tenuissimus]
ANTRSQNRGRKRGIQKKIKQTAEKSTGAPAPRRRIPLPLSKKPADRIEPAESIESTATNKGKKKGVAPVKRKVTVSAQMDAISERVDVDTQVNKTTIQHLSGTLGFGVLLTMKSGGELWTDQRFLENNKNPPFKLEVCSVQIWFMVAPSNTGYSTASPVTMVEVWSIATFAPEQSAPAVSPRTWLHAWKRMTRWGTSCAPAAMLNKIEDSPIRYDCV